MNKIIFTNDQLNWIISNYPSQTISACRTYLNCSESTLSRLAKKLGVFTKKVKQPRFNSREEKEIVNIYLRKETSSHSLMKKFKISSKTFKSILNKHNINYQPFNSMKSNIDIIENVTTLYKNGYSTTQIKLKLQLPYQRVRKILIGTNVQFRNHDDRFCTKYSQETIDKIIHLNCKECRSISDISSIVNIDPNTITTIFRKLGVIPQHNFNGKNIDITYDEKQQIVSSFLITKSIKMTSNIVNRSCEMIKKILNEMNCVIPITRYSYKEDYFDSINSSEKAYILGLLITDGCNSPDINSFSLKLQAEDGKLVEMVNSKVCIDKPVRYSSKGNSAYVEMVVHNKKLSHKLIELGLPQRKTFKIKPETWMTGDFSSAAILGMMDGDGSIYNKLHKRTTMEGVRKEFTFSFIGLRCICLMIQDIFKQKLNINSTVSPHSRYRDNIEKPLCTVHVYGNRQTKIVLDWLYSQSPIFMKRKHDKYLELCEYVQTAHIK